MSAAATAVSRPKVRTKSRFLARRLRVVAALVAACAVFAALCNVAVLRGGRARSSPLEGADVILVLGAGLHADGSPSAVLEDRLQTALDLYRAGRAKRILVSGDRSSEVYDETTAMRSWLVAEGVPREAIVVDGAGFDTFSSCARAREVYGVARAIVVTQRFHLPRSLWLARSFGIDAEGAEADRRPYKQSIWFELREVVSRTKAWVDVATGRRPRSLAA